MEHIPDSLDAFVHTCTPLPCTSFLTECSHEPTRVAWYNTLTIVLDPRQHAERHTHQLAALTDQLQSTMHTVELLPPDGVYPICDPDRTRYMTELITGIHVYRTHVEHLIQIELDTTAAEQTKYMMEDILAGFPPNGLKAVSTSELVAMFVMY